ncbi:MAG: hypothetical protein JWM16_1, partial [Verrucomicrobiales bacterium]|nr:hypothetical protein [Verrucomicrobiales bacterium]
MSAGLETRWWVGTGLATILIALVLGYCMKTGHSISPIGAKFLGYRMSTNGYRVARFSVTNANESPMRCGFWVSPPESREPSILGLFDPDREFIAGRSASYLEGAVRPMYPMVFPMPPGTNLPSDPWVLRITAFDARPPGRLHSIRLRVSQILLRNGLQRLGFFVQPNICQNPVS